jgi:hypothetical protein
MVIAGPQVGIREISSTVATFTLSSIGKTSAAGSTGTPNAAQPGSPPSAGTSPFDQLLQSAGGAAPSAATSAIPAANGAADASAKPTGGTKAQGSGTEIPSPTDGTADTASQNTNAGNDAVAPAGSAPPGGDPTVAAADSMGRSAAPTGSSDNADSDATTPAFDPKLLHDLTSALDELEADEKNGIAPSKDLLKRLQQAVDALSGYLAALQQGAPPPLAGAPAEAASGNSTSTGVSGVSGVATALKQLLSTLADAAPGSAAGADAAPNGAGAGGATGDAADPALAQLTDKLAALSADLAPTQPSLASDLDHLASQLQHFSTAATGSAPQATAAISPGDPAKAATTAALPPGQLATPLPPDVTAGSTGAKNKGASKPENIAVKPATSPATDSKPVATKADADKASGDSNTDATASAAAANTANNVPASPGQAASTGAAAHGAVTLNAAQPTAGPIAAAAQQAQLAYQAADTAPINLPQMAFEIARQVQHGTSEFQIQLAPADLGRVNVTLAVDPTGNVTAHLAVERADTLALLRQDAGNLNQALAQAGLAGGKTNLQFSLSQNPFARQDNGGQPSSPSSAPASDDAPAAVPMPVAPVITRYRGSFATSNLNIFV